MKNLLLVKMQAVLETLAAEGTVSLNTLSERLNIPLPTLSRLVSDMVEMKLVEKIDYYRIAPAHPDGGMCKKTFLSGADCGSDIAGIRRKDEDESALRSL